MSKMKVNIYLFLWMALFMFSCGKQVPKDAVFVLHESEKTGLTFNNKLDVKLGLNVFNYMYFLSLIHI